MLLAGDPGSPLQGRSPYTSSPPQYDGQSTQSDCNKAIRPLKLMLWLSLDFGLERIKLPDDVYSVTAPVASCSSCMIGANFPSVLAKRLLPNAPTYWRARTAYSTFFGRSTVVHNHQGSLWQDNQCTCQGMFEA